MRTHMPGRALSKYYEILEGERKARYLVSKSRRVDFDPDSAEDLLWMAHSDAMSTDSGLGIGSLLDLKSALGNRILERCRLCERACNKDRVHGEKGYCGVAGTRISSDFLHMGEEPDLVPSYTVFFAGCTFNCVFCQNWDISTHPDVGIEVSPAEMARKIGLRASANGRKYGRARNVNWVGGEPTPNLPYILGVLGICGANLPQVWNSNMYMSKEAMSLLDGIVDVYLTDFKYGNDKCATRLSNAPDYMRIVRRNHLMARFSGEMIIRHLVLPKHVDCCTRPVLSWIADNLKDVKVNVMAQYRPEYRARDFPEIAHPLSLRDYEVALGIAHELGLELCD